ncbi:MAG: CRISPR system precrRNA processing endoribonuclease RAMP protein Cas6 [Chloroflexi bacterium]|nr:CRISPR system precrRNA processing endoribonuclease RAMP protein Cas6 [Chloroflexota bacterium]
MSDDLLALVVELEPVRLPREPRPLGDAIRGFWMGELEQAADAALWKRLKEGSQRREYTVSDLYQVEGEARHWLRLTSLTAELTGALLGGELERLPAGRTVHLHESAFRVLGCATRREEHPWAGRDSYAGLLGRYGPGGTPPPRRLRVGFASATTFSRTKRREGPFEVPAQDVRFPLPDKLAESWRAAWDRFAPAPMDPDVDRYAAALALKEYRLETTGLQEYGGVPRNGFLGECIWEDELRRPEWAARLWTLADYAFYCGTGRLTTRGLGLTWAGPG